MVEIECKMIVSLRVGADGVNVPDHDIREAIGRDTTRSLIEKAITITANTYARELAWIDGGTAIYGTDVTHTQIDEWKTVSHPKPVK